MRVKKVLRNVNNRSSQDDDEEELGDDDASDWLWFVE